VLPQFFLADLLFSDISRSAQTPVDPSFLANLSFFRFQLRNPLSAICLAVEGIVDRLNTIVSQEERLSLQAELRDLIKDHDVINLCTQHMRR
jgi:hypothetical protein